MYTQNNTRNLKSTTTQAGVGGGKTKQEAGGSSKEVFRTGLFVPTRDGSKQLASVKLKEAVTIPAGSYINLYKNDDKKSETSPDYTIQVNHA